MAEALAGKGIVVQVNTEANPELAERFGVRGIPALYLLKNGQVLAEMTGAQPPEKLISWFESHM